MKGWVYVITNKAIPNLLKVGYSTKDPELRAEEFNGSGVPYRFVVEYDALVNGPRDVEQKAHSLLKAYHENKEWFKCDITTAITAIRQAANGSVITETTKILTLLPSLSSQPKKNKFIVQDGIATDTDTGLIWLRFAYGQIWLDDTSVGKVKEVCWEDAFDCAKQFNQQGGYADYASWRLPTVSELKSLIDETKNNYINADIFPNNAGSFFWSSTPSSPSNAWVLLPNNGESGSVFNSSRCAVRLVKKC